MRDLNMKGWNSHVPRDLPGEFQLTHLSTVGIILVGRLGIANDTSGWLIASQQATSQQMQASHASRISILAALLTLHAILPDSIAVSL